MASKLLSIEIGQVVTKICEVEGKGKSAKVSKSFMIATPEGVINDGALKMDAGFADALRDALLENRVTTKKAVFSLNSSRIASREVVIPYVKNHQIKGIVGGNAEEYFPVDLSEYRITYSKLGEVIDEKGAKKHRLLVLAVPERLVQGYYNLADACGLEIYALDYMGNSLFHATKGICTGGGTQLVAKIDEQSTLFTVIRDGQLLSVRSVTYGVDETINALMDTFINDGYNKNNFGYEDAINVLKDYACIKADIKEDSEDPEIVKVVSASLEYLVSGITRMIDFHNSRAGGLTIERVHITGLGSSFVGMREFLSKRLGISVEIVGNVSMALPRGFDDSCLGDYIACIGAAVAPVNLLDNVKKAKKGEGAKGEGAKTETDLSMIGLIVGAGGLIVALVLAFVSYLPYKDAQLESERLAAEIERLKPIETVRNTYISTQTLWTDANNMYTLTQNHNDYLVSFIQELEREMPTEILVLNMTANANDVTMNINVSSKEAAAKVLQQLFLLDTIKVVSTTGLNDARDEDSGLHTVSFSVNCVYADRPVEEQETAGQ